MLPLWLLYAPTFIMRELAYPKALLALFAQLVIVKIICNALWFRKKKIFLGINSPGPQILSCTIWLEQSTYDYIFYCTKARTLGYRKSDE